MDVELEKHAEQLAALGHPVRLRVLRFVVVGGLAGVSAGAIAAHVDLAPSTLSHHLKRLVEAGLLTARAEATFVFYRADYSVLRILTDYLWEDCCKNGEKPSCC